MPQAICVHEEDTGILWKHSDNWNGSRASRRNRRLVVSFFVTVGNYDYGFYWYFSLDGTIELEVKATGVVFTSAYPGPGYALRLGARPRPRRPVPPAPVQRAAGHDGRRARQRGGRTRGRRSSLAGPANPDRHRDSPRRHPAAHRARGAAAADNTQNRVLAGDQPVGDATASAGTSATRSTPEGKPVLLADAESDIHRRATYATKHLWVTPYAPDENYPAGDLVNMHPGGAGLPAWTAADRTSTTPTSCCGTPSASPTSPGLEDWPVMPVDSTGFVLKPHGFFGRNPTLDIPETVGDHCAPSVRHARRPARPGRRDLDDQHRRRLRASSSTACATTSGPIG